MLNILKVKNIVKKFFKNYNKIFFVFLFASISLIMIFLTKNILSEKDLKIYTLNMKNSTAILIKTPDEKKILINAGKDEEIIRKIEDKLSIFDKKIDLAVLTSNNFDYLKGFIYLFQKYNIKNILENEDNKTSRYFYDRLQNLIDQNSKNIKGTNKLIANCGDKFYFSNKKLSMYIFHPLKSDLINNYNYEDNIVLFFNYGDYNFLFFDKITKNIQDRLFFNINKCFSEAEKDFLYGKLKDLTVLEISNYSPEIYISEKFLKELKPEYTILNFTKDGEFSLKYQNNLNLFFKYSKNTLNNIENGDIFLETNGRDFEFNMENLGKY